MSQAPPPSSRDSLTGDAENWSAGEPEEAYGEQSSAPPSGRTWDPGPAPGYEVPGFQPLTQPPGAEVPGFQPLTQPPGAGYPPPLGLQVVPAAPTNGLAVASLVLGLVGLFVLPVVAPLLAVIFGHISRGQIRNSGERGGGMAVAGLVLGYLCLAFALIGFLIFIVIVLIAAAAASAAGS